MNDSTPPTSDERIRIFLLDDHEIVRQGIAELLAAVPGFSIVGEAANASDALPRVLASRPDVAVLDMRLPDGDGIDVCREIRSRMPATHCLMLTSCDDHEAVLAAVLAGASGYVLKEVRASGLVDAIRRVAAGQSLMEPALVAEALSQVDVEAPLDPRVQNLTERERQVLELITDGLTNRQIGARLHLTEKTVKNYASGLFTKLGLERRSQAAVFGAGLRRTE